MEDYLTLNSWPRYYNIISEDEIGKISESLGFASYKVIAKNEDYINVIGSKMALDK